MELSPVNDICTDIESAEIIDIVWSEMTIKKTYRGTCYPLEVSQCGGIYWIYWPSQKLLKVGKTNTTISCRVLQHICTHGNPGIAFYMLIEDKRRQHVAELSLKKAISNHIVRGTEWAKAKSLDAAIKMLSGIKAKVPRVDDLRDYDKAVRQATNELPVVQLSNRIQELTEHSQNQSIQIKILERKLNAYRMINP
jgi:hypothetical protein